jgi:hypothetical protein
MPRMTARTARLATIDLHHPAATLKLVVRMQLLIATRGDERTAMRSLDQTSGSLKIRVNKNGKLLIFQAVSWCTATRSFDRFHCFELSQACESELGKRQNDNCGKRVL